MEAALWLSHATLGSCWVHLCAERATVLVDRKCCDHSAATRKSTHWTLLGFAFRFCVLCSFLAEGDHSWARLLVIWSLGDGRKLISNVSIPTPPHPTPAHSTPSPAALSHRLEASEPREDWTNPKALLFTEDGHCSCFAGSLVFGAWPRWRPGSIESGGLVDGHQSG